MVRTRGEAQHYRVLAVIASMQRPTLRTIARESGLSEPTVRASLRWLEGKGSIEADDSMKPHILWGVTERGQKDLLIAREIGEATRGRSQ